MAIGTRVRARNLGAGTCVLLLLACPALARAQGPAGGPPSTVAIQPDPASLRSQLSLGGLVGIPQGGFGDNVGLSGGLGIGYDYRLGESPVRVGAELSVLWYGRKTRRLPFSLTIPDVLVDVTTSSGIVMTHARVRIQPVRGDVRPYVEGMLGLNYVFTETTIDLDDDPFFDDDQIRTTNFRDVAVSAGGGAGFMIELASWPDRRLDLDVGARYLYGGEADYLVLDRLDTGNRVADLDPRRSRTNVLVLRVGGVFLF